MTELLKISLPDGSVREMPAGSTPADVAAAIGPLADRAGVDKAALALIERGMWSEADALTRVAHVLLQAEAGNLDVRLERPQMPEA